MLRRLLNAYFNFHLFAAILGFALTLASLSPWMATKDVAAMLRPFSAIETILLLPFLIAVFATTRLPARTYLPLLLFSLWRATGLWPFFSLQKVDLLRDFMGSGLNLAIALHNLHLRRKLTGNSLGLFTQGFFANGLGFSKLRFFLWFPLFGLACSLFLMLSLIQVSIDEFTRMSKGHARLAWDGLYTRQSVYTKDGRTVYLLGMSHIADKGFYEKTLSLIPTENAVVLAEGVSDRKKLLSHGLDYSKISKILNASEQNEGFHKELFEKHTVLPADVDVSDLSGETVEMIRAIGKLYEGEVDSVTLLKAFDSKGAELFKADLIDFRNQHVMSVHDQVANEYSSIVIPWGALHNGNLEEELLKRGYVLSRSEEVKGLSFF